MARRTKKRTEVPWYADGLTFRCTACGQCCTGEPGHVWVDTDEIRRLARARGLSVAQFKKRFVRRVGRRLSLREKQNGDCVMLENGRCSVYDAKPLRCTTYPFWNPVLRDADEWEENAARCEGIGQGDHYTLEEIEQIRGGDPTPLQKKHARPPETPVVSRYRDGVLLEQPDVTGRESDGIDWDGAFAELVRIYADLERELPRYEFTCAASGNCCDFDAYGHRLYVTTLEAEYFFRNGPEERANDDERQCPQWGTDRLCKARDARMLGCRTYFCGPYPVEPPDALHERYHAKLIKLHERYGIEYAYRDIRDFAKDRDRR
ncbi:MAG: YkgJ family cysteine cluster protein [Planctomycetota bacterium]|nr:YkgJ family cysteine cluster protein [Planctomycetota bacterium]